MARPRSSTFRRRFTVVSIVFGVFVLFDLALFGFLILDSLSRREMDRILLDTREEASEVASQLAEAAAERDQDLFTVIATERETRTFLDSVLQQRDIVETIEVTDRDGIVVFRSSNVTSIPVAEELPQLERGEGVPPRITQEVSESQSFEEVVEEIGDLGWLRIRFDRAELDRRVGILRQDLIRRTLLIGATTLLLLLAAYVTIVLVLRRAQRAEEQAADAERLAYIGTLAAGLAHEIRNPLNALNLNMQMLAEELEDGGNGAPGRGAVRGGASGQRLVTITRSEIDRLERLVTDFLSYARPRPTEPVETAAVELLERARELLAGETERLGVAVTVEDRSGGARVQVDPAQIRQLLLNLLNNSLEALEGVEAPAIRLRATADGDRVALEVTDNGGGMTPEQRERMFELFYSNRKGGTGLGLAVVDRIARDNQGTIEVESAPGRGTTVRLVLPAAGLEEDAARPATSPVLTAG